MDLITAAKEGNIDRIKTLISEGVDVNMERDVTYTSTALMFAAQESNGTSSLEAVRVLLDARANVNTRNGEGNTALSFAVRSSNSTSSLETVKMLLEAGADVNITRLSGLSNLMTASKYSNTDSSLDTVKVLLDARADVNMVSDNGSTALLNASKYIKSSSSLDTVKVLLEAGADPNQPNNFGNTALNTALMFAAVDVHEVDIVETLLKFGANVNSVNSGGYTPLMYAAQKNLSETVKVLLKAGADVNVFNNNGDTPLMYATRNKSLDTVRILLEAGADVNMVSTNGNTALILAMDSDMDIVKILLEAGAYPYEGLDRCDTRECRELISGYIWNRMNTNVNKMAQQYSKSDIQLPKNVWKLILLRNRQQQLCKELSSNKNKYILVLFAEMLEIPTHPDITKNKLCSLISKQLTWGSQYSEDSVQYFKTEEAKKNLVRTALLLGINTNQSIDKIIDEISNRSLY